MKESDKMNDIFNTIMLSRINVIPPYTYDEDESEHDILEYIEYFKKNISMSIFATTNYMHAISNFDNNKIDSLFKEILKCRKVFVEFLPFTYDELESEDEEFGVEYMYKLFESDAERKVLQQNLEKYLNTLFGIKEYFSKND